MSLSFLSLLLQLRLLLQIDISRDENEKERYWLRLVLHAWTERNGETNRLTHARTHARTYMYVYEQHSVSVCLLVVGRACMQTTAVFEKHANSLSQLAGLSFSLIFLDAERKEKTLDVVVENIDEFNMWTRGLAMLLSWLGPGDVARSATTRSKQQQPPRRLPSERGASDVGDRPGESVDGSPSTYTNTNDNEDDDESTVSSTDDGSMSNASVAGAYGGAAAAASTLASLRPTLPSRRQRIATAAAAQPDTGHDAEYFRHWQTGVHAAMFCFDVDGRGKAGGGGSAGGASRKSGGSTAGIDANVRAAPAADAVGDLFVWGLTSFNISPAAGGNNAPSEVGSRICSPVSLESLHDIDVYQVSCGSRHIAVIDDCGELYMYGDGDDGQLGVGYVGNGDGGNAASSGNAAMTNGYGGAPQRKVPHRVQANPWLSGGCIEHTSCGRNCAAVITDSDQLYVWGENKYGQLGVGSTTTYYTPQKVEITAGSDRDDDDTRERQSREDRNGRGDADSNVPSLASMLVMPLPVVYVSCGASHMAAITGNYELYTWGESMFGALGHIEGGDIHLGGICATPRRVDALVGMRTVLVSCGVYHTLAIVLDDERVRMYNRMANAIPDTAGGLGGCVYAWGDNSKCQIGMGKDRSANKIRYRPTQVKDLIDVPVVAIAAGQYHSVALSALGEVYTWGCADDGKLGHPAPPAALPPTANVKPKATSGGRNPISPNPAAAPIDPGVPNRVEYFYNQGIRVVQIGCGLFHSAALGVGSGADAHNGKVYTWGLGIGGRLGLGGEKSAEEPTLVTGLVDRAVRQVHCGDTWTAAICEHKWEPLFDMRNTSSSMSAGLASAGTSFHSAQSSSNGVAVAPQQQQQQQHRQQRKKKYVSLGMSKAPSANGAIDASFSQPVARKSSLTTTVDAFATSSQQHAGVPAEASQMPSAATTPRRQSSLQSSSSSPVPAQHLPPLSTNAAATATATSTNSLAPGHDLPLHHMDPQRAKAIIERDLFRQQLLDAKRENERLSAESAAAKKEVLVASQQAKDEALAAAELRKKLSDITSVKEVESTPNPIKSSKKKSVPAFSGVAGAIESLPGVQKEESSIDASAAKKLAKIAKSVVQGGQEVTARDEYFQMIQEVSRGIFFAVRRKKAGAGKSSGVDTGTAAMESADNTPTASPAPPPDTEASASSTDSSAKRRLKLGGKSTKKKGKSKLAVAEESNDQVIDGAPIAADVVQAAVPEEVVEAVIPEVAEVAESSSAPDAAEVIESESAAIPNQVMVAKIAVVENVAEVHVADIRDEIVNKALVETDSDLL